MRPVLLATKEYAWAVEIFVRLFQKYWGGKLIWYGDAVDNVPDGVEYRPHPIYNKVWPWKHWFGNGFLAILDELDGDVFTLFLPDHWLVKKVKKGAIKSLGQYMTRHGGIVRCGLTEGSCVPNYGEVFANLKNHTLWSVPNDNPHCSLKVTFSPALWDRRELRKFVQPYWDLWDTEVLGSRVTQSISVDATPSPIVRCHGIYKGKLVSLKGLSDEDKDLVLSLKPNDVKVRNE